MLKVEKTLLEGVMLVKPDVFEDHRGNFFETYNSREYYAAGLTANFVQDDISVSKHRVLRGMHGDPKTTKLIQCLHGSIYAVVVDCDPSRETFGKWEAFILTDENHYQLYIPPMYGNGYYVLSEEAVYSYKQDTFYGEAKQFTYKWNDPQLGIRWPDERPILSRRDENVIQED